MAANPLPELTIVEADVSQAPQVFVSEGQTIRWKNPTGKPITCTADSTFKTWPISVRVWTVAAGSHLDTLVLAVPVVPAPGYTFSTSSAKAMPEGQGKIVVV